MNENSQKSILKLFAIFVAASLVVFLLVAGLVIMPKVNTTLNEMLMEKNSVILQDRLYNVRNYLKSRQQMLGDTASHAAVVSATLLSDADNLSMISFLNSTKFLGQTASFALYDFEGHQFFRSDTWHTSANAAAQLNVDNILTEKTTIGVDFIETDQGMSLTLTGPVLYQGSVEGVLVGYVPFSLEDVFDRELMSDANQSITIIKGDIEVTSLGNTIEVPIAQRFMLSEYGMEVELVTDMAAGQARARDLLINYGYSLLGATIVSFGLLVLLGYRIILSPFRELDVAHFNLDKKNKALAIVNEELEVVADKAEKAAEIKSRFLANMSHEIRTPMNGVIGALTLVTSSTDQKERSLLISTALTSANALLHIINDILDVSKLEAGRLEIKKTPFHLKSFLHQMHQMLQPLASEKRLDLNMDAAKNCDCVIVSDHVRLRQIITNFVSNAIKFTNEGHVSISACIEGNDGAYLYVRVDDTGIGIAAEDLKRLFGRFEQLDNRQQLMNIEKGTGLGLSICKQLVDLLGGELGVESIVGKGSHFWCRIPVVISAEKAKEEVVPLEKINERPFHILLAEDNAVNILIFGRMLQGLGHTYQLAKNGFEVIEAMGTSNEESFDLILMDNQMPKMGGLEATKIIRAHTNSNIANIPIIALTADALQEQRDKFEEAGMNGFVGKPVNMKKLCLEIYKVMEDQPVD